MKLNIVFFILIVLLGITVSVAIAQQNGDVPKTDKEVEKLKIQLQTVENEKMEAETKLAEANTKLINAEFGKFERELRDSNNKWLWGWTGFFVGIVAIIGIALWFSVKSLIVDRVEKSLNGFKDAVKKVEELRDQLRYLLRENAVAVLGDFSAGILVELDKHTKEVKALSKEVLMDVFNDKTRDLSYRWLAAEIFVAREYTDLVAPVLNFLKDIIKSNDFDRIYIFPYDPQYHIRSLVYPIGKIHTQDTYKNLRNFIIFLQNENPKNKDSWIAWTAHSFASVSVALNKTDSTVILIESIPDWDFSTQVPIQEKEALTDLIYNFNSLHVPNGIKAILTNSLTDNMPDVEEKCLELLQEHDPKFVREWKEEKKETNEENEENNESEPTT